MTRRGGRKPGTEPGPTQVSWEQFKRVGTWLVAGLVVEIGVAWWLIGRRVSALELTELATAVVAVNVAVFGYWWLEMDLD